MSETDEYEVSFSEDEEEVGIDVEHVNHTDEDDDDDEEEDEEDDEEDEEDVDVDDEGEDDEEEDEEEEDEVEGIEIDDDDDEEDELDITDEENSESPSQVEETPVQEETPAEVKKTKVRKRRIGRPANKQKYVSEEALMCYNQAVMHYINAEYEKAHSLLIQAVRIAPSLKDSYHTLASVHDALGNKKKAIDFWMIAAHLTPKESHLWVTLSNRCEEIMMFQEAFYCLSRGMKYAPKEDMVELHYKRANLLEQLGQVKRAIQDLRIVHDSFPDNIDINIFLAKLLYKDGRLEEALSLLKDFKAEDVDKNRLSCAIAELFMSRKEYSEALEFIEKSIIDAGTKGDREIFELHSKCAICAICLGQKDKSEKYLKILNAEDAPVDVDILLNVGDIYLSAGDLNSAIHYYERLLANTDYDKLTLGLKIAECYEKNNMAEKAMGAYESVLKDFEPSQPEYLDVSLRMAELLNKTSDTKSVLEILDNIQKVPHADLNECNRAIQMLMCSLYTREAHLNFVCNRMERYVDIMLPILIFVWQSTKRKPQKIKKVKKQKRESVPSKLLEPSKADASLFKVNRVFLERALGKNQNTQSAEYKQFLSGKMLIQEDKVFTMTVTCWKCLFQLRQFDNAEKLLDCAKAYSKPKVRGRRLCFKYLSAVLACKRGCHQEAYDIMRTICCECPNSNIFWNFFLRVEDKVGKVTTSGRFIARLRTFNRSCAQLAMASGIHQFQIGHLMHSLKDSLLLYVNQKDNPALTLFIAVNYLHYALKISEVEKKDSSVIKAIAFMERYCTLQNNSMESLYNMACTYQRIGLSSVAERLYREILGEADSKIIVGEAQERKGQEDENSTIKYYAAHNLSKIYYSSGADALANVIIEKYLTI